MDAQLSLLTPEERRPCAKVLKGKPLGPIGIPGFALKLQGQAPQPALLAEEEPKPIGRFRLDGSPTLAYRRWMQRRDKRVALLAEEAEGQACLDVRDGTTPDVRRHDRTEGTALRARQPLRYLLECGCRALDIDPAHPEAEPELAADTWEWAMHRLRTGLRWTPRLPRYNKRLARRHARKVAARKENRDNAGPDC